jgi:hypothetical protein
MVGPAGDVYVAEKDDGVSLHLTLDVDVAEKANGVTHSSAGVYPDVGKEMDGIPVGTSRSRAGCKSGAKQAKGKHSLHHCCLPEDITLKPHR